MADITQEFALQVRQRSEDAPGDDVTFDLGKPQLDLVEPRGIGRSEVQLNLDGFRTWSFFSVSCSFG
jgi:hypothetical protein